VLSQRGGANFGRGLWLCDGSALRQHVLGIVIILVCNVFDQNVDNLESRRADFLLVRSVISILVQVMLRSSDDALIPVDRLTMRRFSNLVDDMHTVDEGGASRKVGFVWSDCAKCKVHRAQCIMQSLTLPNGMLANPPAFIPVKAVERKALIQVVKYIKKHAEVGVTAAALAEWDQEFVDVEPAMVFELGIVRGICLIWRSMCLKCCFAPRGPHMCQM
jgi:hypothetical protein